MNGLEMNGLEMNLEMNMNDELLDIVDSLERCYESWREQVVGILDEEDTDIVKGDVNEQPINNN